jgi:hypothetical protein
MFQYSVYRMIWRMIFRVVAAGLFMLIAVFFFHHHSGAPFMPAAVSSFFSRSSDRGSVAYAHSSVDGTNYNLYSPADNIEHSDYSNLERSRGHLDIAMYAFTDRYLAELLVRLANKGMTIRIYRDGEQYQSEEMRGNSTTSLFHGHANIHVRVKPASRNLMHLKAYSDGLILRDGSANWSPSGLKQQDNNARYTNDSQQIKDFETAFEMMWNRTDNTTIQ